MKYHQLWLVDSEEDANKLIVVGWEFIEVVYEEREIREWKGILSQTRRFVGTKKIPRFLMGRNGDIPARIHDEERMFPEDVDEYLERIKEVENK